MTAGGGGGGGGGGTGDVLFPFKPVGEIVTVSVLGWLSMKGKSVKWISNKTGMKKESLYYHTIYKTLQYIPPLRAEAIPLFRFLQYIFTFFSFSRLNIPKDTNNSSTDKNYRVRTARVWAAKFFNVYFLILPFGLI